MTLFSITFFLFFGAIWGLIFRDFIYWLGRTHRKRLQKRVLPPGTAWRVAGDKTDW